MEHIHEVSFDDLPEVLIEFSRETIWAWLFVMFHVKDCVPNLLLSERSREEFVF